VVAVLESLAVVDREVDGNPQEPGYEGHAAVLEAADRLEGLEEGLRGEVFGQVGVAGEEVGVAENADGVAFVQVSKRFPVALAG
jgi:hypothetical protein